MHMCIHIYSSLRNALHKQASLYYKGQSFVSSSLLDGFKKQENFLNLLFFYYE